MVTTNDAVFLFDFWGINTGESDSLLFSVTIDPNRVPVVYRTPDHRASAGIGQG